MNLMHKVGMKAVAAILSSKPAMPVTQKGNVMRPSMQVPVVLDNGFPPPIMVAVANTWHVNKYYFDATNDQWYIVLECSKRGKVSSWKMQPVEIEDGRPTGIPVITAGDLWADRFADRPFDVRAFMKGELPDTFDWFRENYAANKDIVCQLELFDAYNDRLRYCSSHEALVRLGLCSPV